MYLSKCALITEREREKQREEREWNLVRESIFHCLNQEKCCSEQIKSAGSCQQWHEYWCLLIVEEERKKQAWNVKQQLFKFLIKKQPITDMIFCLYRKERQKWLPMPTTKGELNTILRWSQLTTKAKRYCSYLFSLSNQVLRDFRIEKIKFTCFDITKVVLVNYDSLSLEIIFLFNDRLLFKRGVYILWFSWRRWSFIQYIFLYGAPLPCKAANILWPSSMLTHIIHSIQHNIF